MLLAVFKSLGRAARAAAVVPACGVAVTPEELLSQAEALHTGIAAIASPFGRDAAYDEVTSLMARAYGPTLWRYCVSHHGADPTQAEDLAQQALLTFRLALPGFEGRSTLKTFLYGITSNVCRADRVREARRRDILAADAATVAELLHHHDDEAEAALERERLEALERALARLPAREAFLVRARLGEQLGYEQILPRFQARFGGGVTTAEGLRTLFFHTKRRLVAILAEDE